MGLIEFLRRRLSPEDLAILREEIEDAGNPDYEAAIRRVAKSLKKDEEMFAFARTRLELRYSDLVDLPAGRRTTILRNSSPILLLVLYRELIQGSWGERFGNHERSQKLAVLAFEVAVGIADSGYLSREDSADLLAESLVFLSNAQRINSDMRGAEQTLWAAEQHLLAGTGDRALKADYLRHLAFIRVAQGRCTEALAICERELSIRSLLGDEEELVFALVQRGHFSSLAGEPIARTIDHTKAAMARVKDHKLMLQAIHSLSELLAREGFGYQAVKFLGSVQMPLYLVNEKRFQIQHVWIEAIACRALREHAEAESLLRRVREDLARVDSMHKLAIASLDLACVYAARGKPDEVRQLAEEAYAIFKAEGLEERALTAVVVLKEAIEAERVTEGLAVAVANFLARFPYNKALRFEWKDE